MLILNLHYFVIDIYYLTVIKDYVYNIAENRREYRREIYDKFNMIITILNILFKKYLKFI